MKIKINKEEKKKIMKMKMVSNCEENVKIMIVSMKIIISVCVKMNENEEKKKI